MNKLLLTTAAVLACNIAYARPKLCGKWRNIMPHTHDKILCNDNYVSIYNIKRKEPDMVAYTVNPVVSYHIKRRGYHFKMDKRVPHNEQANDTYYKHTGYDRGHLAPFEAMASSKRSAHQSMLYTNITPQKKYFNRVKWYHLERDVRVCAAKLHRKLLVYVIPQYTKNDIKIHGLDVPSKITKAIIDPHNNQVAIFVVPQLPKKALKKIPLKKLRVTIQQIERKYHGVMRGPQYKEMRECKFNG